MHRIALVACVGVLALPAHAAGAQERYPVSVGLGGGIHPTGYHGLALVTLTPAKFPVSLRLDGMVGRQFPGKPSSRPTSALSASALITLRPWRVAPYLIVGASRTGESVLDFEGHYFYTPAQTELTGGLGLGWRFGRGTLFGEMRTMGRFGSPLTIGLSF